MNDRFTIRTVTIFLGLFALSGMAGIVWLVHEGKPAPEGLLTLVAGSVGAMGAMLSSTRTHDAEPQAVTVQGGQGGAGSDVQVDTKGT